MENLRKIIRRIIRESIVSEREVSAYHGSPYEFEKFTTSKMGTGEGAQAFGWGLYFTDLEDIAKGYAEKLGNVEARIYINGKELAYGHPLFDYKNFILRANGNTESILKELKEIQELEKDFPKNARTRAREKAIAFLEKNPKIKIDANRVIYKVSLHKGKSPEQYTWLEWDKPLDNKIINAVASQLEKEGYNPEPVYPHGKKTIRVTVKNEYGEDQYRLIDVSGKAKKLYDELGRIIGSFNNEKWDKAASLFLLRAGIDGIKYPAESLARGATSDTSRGYNYVVFDENAVSIEKVDKI